MSKKILRQSKEVRSWNRYWEGKGIKSKRFAYDFVASFYRRYLIKPCLNHFTGKYFKKNGSVLHAGCGGGEIDLDAQKNFKITALDFSPNAIKKYEKLYRGKSVIVKGDVRSLKFKNNTFDGIYNSGVLEHFYEKDIKKILSEFARVLKRKGTLIIFWPPEFGISVLFFKTLVFICRDILGIRNVEFHPLEVSRLKSKKAAKKIFKDAGFNVVECYYGWRDLFTNIAIVARKS